MSTLVVLCAGLSTRFPGMRPKYLLTQPDGRLMVDAALDGLDLSTFSRIIFALQQAHVEAFEADTVLSQAFAAEGPFEIFVLEGQTSGPLETAATTCSSAFVSGAVVFKDCDCSVGPVPNSAIGRNFVCTVDAATTHVDAVQRKARIEAGRNGKVARIMERGGAHDSLLVAGTYGFEDAPRFVEVTSERFGLNVSPSELFLSDAVNDLITKGDEFRIVPATEYLDWGSASEWHSYQRTRQTLFLDFDGVLVRNSGRYGLVNWDSAFVPLVDNLRLVSDLHCRGASIVVTTARPSEYEGRIREFLAEHRIRPREVLCGLSHAPRTLVNDYAPSNPYPSAMAINVPRDGELRLPEGGF